MKVNVQLKKLNNPLVSIVMTIYNEAHCVRQAIDTLLAQEYKNIELVLVNNGSKDDTQKVIEEYKKDKRVKLLSLEKNAGPGGGRNAGAKIATGDILVFIDADMVFDKHYIGGLIKPIVEGKTVGTFHSTEKVKNIDNLWARSLCINRIIGNPQISGVFRAVLRKPFLETGGFDTSKGYFDDALPGLGHSIVAQATCYHNNPEGLGEIYKHSRWVGKSLIQNTESRKKFTTAVIGSFAVLLALILMAVVQFWTGLAVIGIAAVAALVLFLLMKTIPRTVEEGRPEYLYSIPIVWLVRLAGYYVGAAKQVLAGNNA